jgi:alpha-L-fucosidase 2
MLLQSHLRSIDADASEIAKAAFVAYRRDANTPNHFPPVVPGERLVDAPYILHLLPALPSAWPNGRIDGLRARGGFEVDMQWKDGRLVAATIRTEQGGTCRLYVNDKLTGNIELQKGQAYSWPGPTQP